MAKNNPWLLVEAKWGDTDPSPHFWKLMRYVPGSPALQVVRTPDVWARTRLGDSEVLVASASEALARFV